MSLRLISSLCGATLMLAPSLEARAAEVLQGFMNPSFGGNPGYYGNLMGHANTINNFKDPSQKSSADLSSSTLNRDNTPRASASQAAATGAKTPTNTDSEATRTPSTGELFQKRLEGLILTALATRLVNQAFGLEDGSHLPETLNTGFNTIAIEDLEGFTRLTITDNASGGETVIDIPKF